MFNFVLNSLQSSLFAQFFNVCNRYYQIRAKHLYITFSIRREENGTIKKARHRQVYYYKYRCPGTDSKYNQSNILLCFEAFLISGNEGYFA